MQMQRSKHDASTFETAAALQECIAWRPTVCPPCAMLLTLNLASITLALWLTAEQTSLSPVATSYLWPILFTRVEEKEEAEVSVLIPLGKLILCSRPILFLVNLNYTHSE